MSNQFEQEAEYEQIEQFGLNQLEGIVESVIFQNNENGYTVFTILSPTDDNDIEDEITCIAYMGPLNPGESIRLFGNYVVHPSYGRQFNVQRFEKNIPTTLSGIQKYLGSGIIKGVGEKLAQKIVSKFKDETFHIIEYYPEKLSEIRGITLEKAISIGTIFKEQEEQRRSILFLQDYGISPAYAMKIYSRYKSNTITIIRTNPYRLADDIFGIGFHIADKIAAKVGFDSGSPFRIKAGIKYILSQAGVNGHVYLPKDDLIQKSADMLEMREEIIDNCIIEMQMERSLMQERLDDGSIGVYLNSYFYAESYTAKKLLQISGSFSPAQKYDPREIKALEKASGITLANNQRQAVLDALNCGVLVITGGPGTGKTTTINTIIKMLENEGLEIELAAPTGRAAKRITEATGKEAKTIHRLLGMNFRGDETRVQFFEKNEENELDTDVIIIDETSMVDIMLMHSLLKAIPDGVRLILVGDADQLPSVGAGNVLKDIINSGVIKVAKLTEIFRQAQESAIVVNAHRINNGEYPLLNEKHKDFFFMRRNRIESVIETIIDLVTDRLPIYADCDRLKDIQVLTPMRKSPLGVTSLNTILQAKLNPPDRNKKEKEFRSITYREGDKVMQIKNNYNMVWRTYRNGRQTDEGTGVYNGDEGIIISIDDNEEVLRVAFDDGKTVQYDYSQLEELDLSYAVTIHKSQGSEYKVVVIPVHSGPPMLLSRNLLYTAVTRAKQLAVLVGVPETLHAMVDNNREINRYSALNRRLVKMSTMLM